MNIRLSIYDFFAYTIPGGMYLFVIAYICFLFDILHIDLSTFAPSFFQSLLIAGIAYVLGVVFEPVAKAWYKLFKPKNFPEKALQKFQEGKPHIAVNFQATDWPILLAYIRRENMELAEYIERDNAYNLMLRSLSLGLLLLGITQITQFAITLSVVHIVFGIALLLASALSLKLSLTFAIWFYLLIYETTTARTLPGLDKVTLKETKSPTSGNSEKQ